jgi:hypothetical protein
VSWYLARHLAVWLVGAALLRFAVVPPEACPAVTADEVGAAAVAAGDWLVRNLDDDGRFLYGYDLATNTVNSGYNIVRHAGAMNTLYQLVSAGEPQFLAPADRALGYLLDRRVDHEDYATVLDPGSRARLGTVGFLVVALVQRRAITGEDRYDDLLHRLGRFIVAQQEPDGALLAFWSIETGEPSPGEYGKFATGEAVWALAELDNVFPGEGWWEAASRTLHYLADGARARKEGHATRLPDHWAAYALEAAGPDRLDDELIDYARRIAGYFSLRLRVEAQRTDSPWRIAVRGYPGPPSGVGTAAEGMAALWRLAGRDARLADLRDDMADRMVCDAGLMVQRQVGVAEAAEEPDPSLALGAWFYRSYTQVDNQQHVLSGLLGAKQAMRGGNP